MAPAFFTANELNDAYLNHKVIERSIWVPPSTIGPLVDSDEHWVAFDNTEWAFICSNPVRINATLNADAFSKQVLTSLQRQDESLNLDRLRALVETLISIIRQSARRQHALLFDEDDVRQQIDRIAEKVAPNPRDTPATVLSQIAYIAKTFYDCETLVAVETE